MNDFKARLNQFLQSDRGMAVILAVITLISFGIFLPAAGFYWDDWIWKFFSYAYSSEYLLWQPIDRPLAGTLHVLLDAVFGDNPLNWQLGNLFFRWVNAAGFYLVLRKVFPADKIIPGVLAMLFLVFPVFSEQWISIAFIHHLVPMAVLWLSFILMFAGIESERWNTRLRKIGLSVLLAGLVMLTTEYYFGIEAFRVVLLGYYFLKHDPPQKLSGLFWQTVKVWWAYAGMMLLMVVWRSGLGVAEGASYSVNLSRMFEDGVGRGALDFLAAIFTGMYSATVNVLIKTFSLPVYELFGLKKTLLYTGLVAGVYILSTIFLRSARSSNTHKAKDSLELVLLGLSGMIIGGLPFWIGGLQYKAGFPNDRLGLSLMMGASFLIAGLVMSIFRSPRVSSGLLGLLLAFSVGANFISGAAYAQSWKEQQVFWGQFVTRVPALEPGTVVISPQLPADFMSDLSWMMTLNWLYDPAPSEEGMQYGLFFSNHRGMLGSVSDQMPVVYDQRMVYFDSQIENALVISYNKNSCLHVFDPADGFSNPNVQHIDPAVLPYSNMGQIKLDGGGFEGWLDFLEPPTADNWCHFYQLGELALQRGDHAEVARIGDEAFSRSEKPKKAWERAPFIEGYGFSGRWEDALRLTEEAMRINAKSEEYLCSVWERIDSGTPDSEAKRTAFTELEGLLTCENE